jgi:hypothetical protein
MIIKPESRKEQEAKAAPARAVGASPPANHRGPKS